MSEITTHERPGVYSSYEASSLTAASAGGGAVAVVADGGDAAGSGVYTWTSYSRAAADVGQCALSELARLALKNGAGVVYGVAAGEDYAAAFEQVAALEGVAVVVCELGLYLDDNEIIFNGDGLAEGLQAIIGAFFHSGQAGLYLGRFTNNRKISSETNYGLYFAIANGRYNFAALGLGDIVMRGNVEGIALNSVSFTANNQSKIIDLSNS